jgi:hypothetical protein
VRPGGEIAGDLFELAQRGPQIVHNLRMDTAVTTLPSKALTRFRSRADSLAVMRLPPLLLSAAVLLLGCAADDGFRARLAQGCRSELECSQLLGQAESRVQSVSAVIPAANGATTPAA